MRVLSASTANISKKTDIIIDFEEIKLGRRVDAIRFIAREKSDAPKVQPAALPPDPEAAARSNLIPRIIAYGIGQERACALVGGHPVAVVQYNLDQLDRILKSPRASAISNPAGRLIAAIEEGRGEQLSILDQRQEKVAKAKSKEARIAELRDVIKSVRQLYKSYRKGSLESHVVTLSQDKK